jgi:hypothetical protein
VAVDPLKCTIAQGDLISTPLRTSFPQRRDSSAQLCVAQRYHDSNQRVLVAAPKRTISGAEMRIGPVQDGQKHAGGDACFAGYYVPTRWGKPGEGLRLWTGAERPLDDPHRRSPRACKVFPPGRAKALREEPQSADGSSERSSAASAIGKAL